MRSLRRAALILIALGAMLLLARCSSPSETGRIDPQGLLSRDGVHIRSVSLDDPASFAAGDEPISLAAARNETTSCIVQISGLPISSRRSYRVRIQTPKQRNGAGTIAADEFSAFQVVSLPVDLNRAGFIRHTGLDAQRRRLPRALLPMAMKRGVMDLTTARDPRDPSNPQSRGQASGQPLLIWLDLHLPTRTPAGDYTTSVEVLDDQSNHPLAAVPLHITVYDFVLPDERNLVMTSRLEWDDLRRLYRQEFDGITPRLMNRTDRRYEPAVKVLDSLMKLAERNRVELVVPELQPTVKWPAAKPPAIDWSDFDSLVSPWLDGKAFADEVPLGCWALPSIRQLDRYDRASQLQYWKQAAGHFDEKNWLVRSPLTMELAGSGRADGAEALQLCADAARLLKAYPRLDVMLPLEQDQIQLASPGSRQFIDPSETDRLITAAPGIVLNSPLQPWPQKVKPPQHWLRTDTPGLVPYIGAGADQRGVRVWAWLAFLRKAEIIQWGSALPRTSSPAEPSNPDDLVWFYPGSWFGLDEPVPTIQLKWLRRAQQDYEYLDLARQRGEVLNATIMARLLTKPVEIQPAQNPDPTYALMTGTADPDAWSEGEKLLARTILLRVPGSRSADAARTNALNLDLLRWIAPQEQALLLARSARWGFGPQNDHKIDLNLGIDIYNASDTKPAENQLRWTDSTGQTSLPRGWDVDPAPMPIPALATYHVQRFGVQARFDLDSIDAKDHRPAELTFVNGDNNATSKLRFVLPVAPSDRVDPGLNIEDARLDDWNPADLIQDGPMVRMLNRPALQKQQIQLAQQPARIFTGWGDQNFYVAFQLNGASPQTGRSRNFVDYQFRRAWGEDCCELLVQPVFDDNSLGPVLHIVCKPNGQWIERKRDPRLFVDPWQAFEGAAIRYSSEVSPAGVWNGELSIPWKAITARDGSIPSLLRFNVSQHVNATGESASWAGPIDYGRDDDFMGLLYIRDLKQTSERIAGQ
jgi:hypothetical protein